MVVRGKRLIDHFQKERGRAWSLGPKRAQAVTVPPSTGDPEDHPARHLLVWKIATNRPKSPARKGDLGSG